MKPIRWIAILPCAVTSAIIANYFIKFIFSFSIIDLPKWFMYGNTPIIISVQSLAFPLVFLIIGLLVAPSNKRKTGFVLACLITLYVLAFLIFYLYYDINFKVNEYLFFIFHGIGCIGAFASIPKNDEEFKNDFES